MQTYDRGRNINREMQREFRGISHKIHPAETEFSAAVNLSSREYPALTTRRERRYITKLGRCVSPSLCVIDEDNIAYISDDKNGKSHVTINGKHVYEIGETNCARKLVKMGIYLCVFPDGIVYNTEDSSVKNIAASIGNNTETITISDSTIEGNIAIRSETEPSNAQLGDIWYNPEENKCYLCTAIEDKWLKKESVMFSGDLDIKNFTRLPEFAVQVAGFSGGQPTGDTANLYYYTGGTYINLDYQVPISAIFPETNKEFALIKGSTIGAYTLYQYAKNKASWTAFPVSYSRIELSGTDISKIFSVGDVIEITDCGYTRVYTVSEKTDDETGYIVVDHVDLNGRFLQSDKPIQISRNLPEGLSNVIECSNRLWATDSKGRAIYASKLGDPFNWYAFSGLASDSYAITVGSGGAFTDAIAYDGYPHFFKENSILKVYGSYPFSLYSINCPGVAKNASGSAAILRGAIIYKSVDGFYLYDGSYPSCISDSIQDICGSDYKVTAATADNRAYYAAVYNDESQIYVYEGGVWHMQDAPSGEEANVPSMIFTGRDIIAAFTADDAEKGAPTVYLVSFCGNTYSWGSGGVRKLSKCFIAQCDVDGEKNILRVDEDFERFVSLSPGTMFYIDGVEDIFYATKVYAYDENVAIEYCSVNSSVLELGTNYEISIFEENILKWSFVTPLLGLSLPDDKYYSHFILRYTSQNPVLARVVSNDKNSIDVVLPAKATLGSAAVNLTPHRADYVRLHLKGEGEFALISIARNIEGGTNP